MVASQKKERFLARRKNKLMSRRDGSFKVLAKVRNNAYELEFPRGINLSTALNMEDCS